MDDARRVVDDGAVYVRGGLIADVASAAAPPPDGFEGAPVVAVGGTIYPGLIELHNHLSYDALPLWAVPERYGNRDQWGSGGRNARTYRRLISGPMSVLGGDAELTAAVTRYVETKALIGGTTTSQGVALYSNQGITKYYSGVVRNVEQPLDAGLPAAFDRIADVVATDASRFLTEQDAHTCLLLHLAEGTDPAARGHFESLHLPDGSWAIRPSLAGIHSVALGAVGLQVMADHQASVVWSPLSNLLLYGDTMDVAGAKAADVRMGIGSDWSPSGSKNLFGELKVARLVSRSKGGVFSDVELLDMATRNAAGILGWDGLLGSVERNKFADLVVLAGIQGDPYDRFLSARESAIELVVIAGVPRCGRVQLMAELGVGEGEEPLDVGAALRTLYLTDPAALPTVAALSFAQARTRLAAALADLPGLAARMERPTAEMLTAARSPEPRWFLQLDQDEPPGIAIRPHLPGPDGRPTAETPIDLTAAAEPLSTVLQPIELDPVTVADDPEFLHRIEQEPNVWADVKAGLAGLYG
ncbi:MAG: amidohydrolase family protein [Actinomycetota bacterium]